MAALSLLKDSIVDVIRVNPDPRLDAARDILRRIDNRDLYSCIGCSRYDRSDPVARKSEEDIRQEMVAISRAYVSLAAAGTQGSHGYGTLHTQESLQSGSSGGGGGGGGGGGSGRGGQQPVRPARRAPAG